MTKTSKFDLENELIAAGFAEETVRSLGGYTVRAYRKSFEKPCKVAWYGDSVHRFEVEVQVCWDYNHRPCSVVATYSNGKVKEHGYDKRAYNAVRDTIKNNGFDIAC